MILLQSGDNVVTPEKTILESEGPEALLQQALIRLKAHKGAFALDRTLGSELYKLDIHRSTAEEIEPLIREAIAPVKGIRLIGVEREGEEDRLKLRLYFEAAGETAQAEISVEN